MKNSALTRKNIIHSARNLFSLQGKNGVSIGEIARQAGVNKAGIYYHFQNKEDLYQLILKNEFRKMVDDLHDRLFRPEAAKSLTRKLVEGFMWYWQENPVVFRLLINEINSGADLLIEFIRASKSNELKHKIYNIFKLVDSTFAGKTEDGNERIQRFINFMGITMIYFLLAPFFNKLFDIPEHLQREFVEKRIETLGGMMEYLKKYNWL